MRADFFTRGRKRAGELGSGLWRGEALRLFASLLPPAGEKAFRAARLFEVAYLNRDEDGDDIVASYPAMHSTKAYAAFAGSHFADNNGGVATVHEIQLERP